MSRHGPSILMSASPLAYPLQDSHRHRGRPNFRPCPRSVLQVWGAVTRTVKGREYQSHASNSTFLELPAAWPFVDSSGEIPEPHPRLPSRSRTSGRQEPDSQTAPQGTLTHSEQWFSPWMHVRIACHSLTPDPVNQYPGRASGINIYTFCHAGSQLKNTTW